MIEATVEHQALGHPRAETIVLESAVRVSVKLRCVVLVAAVVTTRNEWSCKAYGVHVTTLAPRTSRNIRKREPIDFRFPLIRCCPIACMATRHPAHEQARIRTALPHGPRARAAVDITHAMNSSLTLITVAPPLSHYVTLGAISSETMRKELERWAEGVLTEASAAVPEDVVAR